MSTKKRLNAISLRTIHTLLIASVVLLAGLNIYSTYYLSSSFKDFTEHNDRNIEMRNAVLELKDASDFMTENVQCFVVNGDMSNLQAYYDEAFIVQHREKAVNTVASDKNNTKALESLQAAMDYSQALMDKEYYAIRLVVEAKGYKDYKIPLDDVVLSAEDQALNEDGKMRLAAEYVFNDNYYAQKRIIRKNIQACLDELEKQADETQAATLKDIGQRLLFLHILIVVGTLIMLFLVLLASRLGINPILKAVENIKNNSKIPETGAKEFQYLIQAYNKMYDVYKESMERLNYKAYHDELTGVYNRAGYESIISDIELSSTYMLLFDIDGFKIINDTYGHETGDMVLTKLVRVLQNNFRPNDSICRVGGDEFVVFMLHFPQKRDDLVAQKIEKINRELMNTDDGLPSVSISVGIVHGSDAKEVDDLFEKTDVAMYQSKQKGKSTYTFY